MDESGPAHGALSQRELVLVKDGETNRAHVADIHWPFGNGTESLRVDLNLHGWTQELSRPLIW